MLQVWQRSCDIESHFNSSRYQARVELHQNPMLSHNKGRAFKQNLISFRGRGLHWYRGALQRYQWGMFKKPSMPKIWISLATWRQMVRKTGLGWCWRDCERIGTRDHSWKGGTLSPLKLYTSAKEGVCMEYRSLGTWNMSWGRVRLIIHWRSWESALQRSLWSSEQKLDLQKARRRQQEYGTQFTE